MIYFVLTITIAYLSWKEWVNSLVIKDLTTKLISKNVGEYVYASTPQKDLPESQIEPDPYMDIENSEAWDDPKAFLEALKGGKNDK